MTVVEVWPGTGGWYTEMLAPLLAEHGKLYVATMAPAPGNGYVTRSLAQLRREAGVAAGSLRQGRPSRALGPGEFNARAGGQRRPRRHVPQPSQLDGPRHRGASRSKRVASRVEAGRHPGRRRASSRSRETGRSARDDRLRERGIRDRAHRSGRLRARSSDRRSTRTRATRRTTSRGSGRCRPPTGLGNRERAKYEAIGESDRFTLKFRKR